MTGQDISFINLLKKWCMKINPDSKFNEIGGNFWLKPDQLDKRSTHIQKDLLTNDFKDIIYTSSGRGAIRLFLEQNISTTQIVLLPYFTCESVIEPFIDCDYKIIYYEIETDFSIDQDKLEILIKEHNPSVLYLQSYFGFDTLKDINSFINTIKTIYKITVVEDLTHSLFGDYDHTNADYFVGSLRKWLEIPDGGILISKNSFINRNKVFENESGDIVNLFSEASKLKDNYTVNLDPESKDKFRKLFYKAEDILDHQKEIYPISQISKYVLSSANFSTIRESRINNYNFLFENLSDVDYLNLVLPKADNRTIPLYFCVRCKDVERTVVQKLLALEGIYATIIWPKSKYIKVEHYRNESFFYDDLLCIPCDQRYSLSHMKHIVNTLKIIIKWK